MEKEEAKKRAEQLQAFREGLATFEQDGVYDRDQQNLDRLDSYERRMQEEVARIVNAEALAAKKRFRRRLGLALLLLSLLGGIYCYWTIRTGYFSVDEIWKTISTRIAAILRNFSRP